MIAVLFARADSIYKTIPSVDVWDAQRDARNWLGDSPVIAHPPCAQWGQLSHMARDNPEVKALALFAVEQVRKHGGVLEHPKLSKLWAAAGLPKSGAGVDQYGGWTMAISQKWFGHRAEKQTLLYIVGCAPADIPEYPITLGYATHICGSPGRRIDGSRGRRPEITHAEREHTPIELARWLCELAAKCQKARE